MLVRLLQFHDRSSAHSCRSATVQCVRDERTDSDQPKLQSSVPWLSPQKAATRLAEELLSSSQDVFVSHTFLVHVSGTRLM